MPPISNVAQNYPPSIYRPRIRVAGAGFFGLPGWNWDTNVNRVIVAGTIYFVPFFVESTRQYTGLSLNVLAAAGGGSLARVGIYTSSPTGYPDALVVDGGNVAIDAIAGVTANIAETLPRGLYWLAVVCDAICTLQGISTGQWTQHPIYSMMLTLPATHETCIFNVAGQIAQVAGGLADPATAGATLQNCQYAVARIHEP